VRQAGWYDCVYDKLGKEVQTWFRAGDHLLQDDHAFCNPGLGDRLQEVWVAGDAARPGGLGLSDHAPLILDFEVAPISVTSLTDPGPASR
jgi:exonuclease III